MSRKEIGTQWDRDNRNAINENFKNLFYEFTNVVEVVSEKAYGDVIDAVKLNWQEPVSSQSNLPSEAEEGDTRFVRDTGKVYRFNGEEWNEIQQIDAGPVNEVERRFNDNLNSINQQLAQTAEQKADKKAVENSLITKRDKSIPIGINDADEELLAAIQGGEGTAFNLESVPRDNSVTPEKTDFARRSKNLFNKNDVVMGYRIDASTGELIPDDAWATSKFIRVEPMSQYKKSHVSLEAIYREDGSFIRVTSTNSDTFLTDQYTAFVRVAVRLSEIELYQLEKGSTTTTYEEWGLKLPDYTGGISEEKASTLVGSKLMTIIPLANEYPDIFHDITPTIERILPISSIVRKDFVHSWRNKEYGLRMEVKGAQASARFNYDFPSVRNIPHVQAVNMWFYVDNPNNITNLTVELGHESTAGHQWASGITTFKKGWNLYRVKATAGNIGEWQNFYRLRVVATTTGDVSITVGFIALEQTQKAKLLFVEDGGYVEFLERAYPELKARGIPTTWALNPGILGERRRITEAQVDELAGDYMSSFSFHSWASDVHSTMTSEEVADNAIKCVRWLQRKGLKPDYLYRAAITQNNAPNHEVLKNIVEAYSSPNGRAGLEIFPFMEPYGTPRITLHGRPNSLVDDTFNQLEKTRCLMIGYTHGVGLTIDGDQSGGDMTMDEWEYFLSKVDEGLDAGWLEGVTYDQLRKRYSRPLKGWGIENLISAI